MQQSRLGFLIFPASVGLYGAMSFNVARRTGEIGIRMALGAQRLDIARMVLREMILLVAAGLALGIAVSSWTHTSPPAS
jgi:ABC-type antimicrobial peptide transport system permease subunit